MKESIASNFRTLVLTIALAMVAIAVGLVTPNRAYAQVPTQEAACDFRSQPLPVTLLPGQRGRVSLSRITEILAEDLTPAQTAQALAPVQFAFPRLVTRARTSYDVSTVAAIVAAIYIGGDQAVSTSLVREIISLVKRLGRDRVSIEETWRYCNQVNVTTGVTEQVRSTGGVCADGTLALQGNRSRTLQSSFDGDFYEGSAAQGRTVDGVFRPAVQYHGWFGHSLRVNLKGFDRTTPFSFSIPRVYDAQHSPRPGARLCKRLPELAREAAHADNADKQRRIFGEQGNLVDAAAAEGDMLAVRWANAFTNGTVNPTVARTDATAGCEQREVFLNGTIAHQGRVIEDLNNKMVARNVTINGWRNVATVGYALFILAVILLITFVVRKRREMLMFIENWEKRVASTAAQAKKEFWLGLEPGLRQMINALRGNLPAGESFAWVESLAGAPSVASATAGDPSGFFRHARTAFAVAVATKPAAAPTEGSVQPQVGEAKPPRLPPPSTTPIFYVDDNGLGMEIKAQADFDVAAKAIDAAAFQRGVESIGTVVARCAPYTGVTYAASPTAPSVFTLSGVALEPSEVEFTLTTIHVAPALVLYHRIASLTHRVEDITMSRVGREYAGAIRVGAELRGDLDRAVVHIRGLEGQLVSLLSFLRKMVLAKRVPLNEHPEVERLLIHLGTNAISPDIKRGAKRVTGAYRASQQAQKKRIPDDEKVTRAHAANSAGNKTAPHTPSAIAAQKAEAQAPTHVVEQQGDASEAVTTEAPAAVLPARPSGPRPSAAPHPAVRVPVSGPPPAPVAPSAVPRPVDGDFEPVRKDDIPTAPHSATNNPLVEKETLLAAIDGRTTDHAEPEAPAAQPGERRSPAPDFRPGVDFSPFAGHAPRNAAPGQKHPTPSHVGLVGDRRDSSAPTAAIGNDVK